MRKNCDKDAKLFKLRKKDAKLQLKKHVNKTLKLKMEENTFPSICRLCAQEIAEESSRHSIAKNVTFNEDETELELKFVIDFCLDININLDLDRPSIPKEICNECFDRLKFIFEFKQFCKSNNDQYFTCKMEVEPDVSTLKAEVEIKEEDDDGLLVEVVKDSSPSVPRKPMSNAERQKLKRRKETEEERAIRTEKAARLKRARRSKLQADDPEAYANMLAKEAERSRIRRQTIRILTPLEIREQQDREIARLKRERRASESPAERASRLAKAAEQARQRRMKLKLENPQKYEAEKAKAAEQKRLQRSSGQTGGSSKAKRKRSSTFGEGGTSINSDSMESESIQLSDDDIHDPLMIPEASDSLTTTSPGTILIDDSESLSEFLVNKF